MIYIEEKKGKQIVQWALHLLLWGFLFCFPLFFSENNPKWQEMLQRHWQALTFSAVIFYTNYFFLVDRFLMKRKVSAFVIFNILLILVCLIALESIHEVREPQPPLQTGPPPPFSRGMNWFRQGSFLLLAVCICVAVKLTIRWYRAEAQRKKTENEHLKSELTYLRYQLQPHFFFNTLNNIYSLVDQDPSLAQKSIHHLSKLMRYLLYESSIMEVPLTKEVTFIKDYVYLMQLRVPRQTDIQLHFPATIPDLLIAPLLFVSLVENAFKHGVQISTPSFVHMYLETDEQQIRFMVENSNYPKTGEDRSGSGIGLKNLKKRLKIIYPNRYALNIETDEKKYITQLTIIS
ncbi:hypothetical protein OKW21_004561 [Catalinimonas alkaloidigena]|uniref:sensor histidine kinase n=1 Tax=Catalinimonas alkaloidigena TaxID=1075417 RepID=UPI0024058711|nr:histidine kinase [Catalinimonas alkaloidigena]MDF9799298.1 hypothetical protein [Catalinimonas alkaloidigena]